MPAQYSLGRMLLLGKGTARDFDKAAAFYRLAADQGHSGAMYQLGWLHEKGYGLALDKKQAAVWYRAALARGRLDESAVEHATAYLAANP